MAQIGPLVPRRKDFLPVSEEATWPAGELAPTLIHGKSLCTDLAIYLALRRCSSQYFPTGTGQTGPEGDDASLRRPPAVHRRSRSLRLGIESDRGLERLAKNVSKYHDPMPEDAIDMVSSIVRPLRRFTNSYAGASEVLLERFRTIAEGKMS